MPPTSTGGPEQAPAHPPAGQAPKPPTGPPPTITHTTPAPVTAPVPAQTPPRTLTPADLDSRGWLSADETPLNNLYHWTWATMLPPADPGHFTFATGMPCVTTTLDSLGATAVIPHDTDPTVADPNLPSMSVQERLFIFPDAPHAAAAFTAVRNSMNACAVTGGAATSPGTHATARTDDGAAWATYPQPLAPGVYNAEFENHDYLVVKGSLIGVVTVGIAGTGQPDAAYPADDDQNVLASVAKHLALYS